MLEPVKCTQKTLLVLPDKRLENTPDNFDEICRVD